MISIGPQRDYFVLILLTVIVCSGHFLFASQIHSPHLLLEPWETELHLGSKASLATRLLVGFCHGSHWEEIRVRKEGTIRVGVFPWPHYSWVITRVA